MSASELLKAGAVLANKYRVECVLGSGGMGVVVAAQHLLLGRSVAVKLVLPDARNRARSSARLLREARAAAKLPGKHVAQVFDVDTLADGTHYLVMERLTGCTLRCLLDQETRLSCATALGYVADVCEALAELHAAGIVHRDVKPSNLFLVREPGARRSVRLLDLGVCRTLDGDAEPHVGLPSDEGFVGSPPYVSPEQLACPADVDARADIWSLGVVLYECLTGELPFGGPTLSRLWESIMLGAVPDLGRELGVPLALERIVRRCLEKNRHARYASVRALALDLADVRASSARRDDEPSAQSERHLVRPSMDAVSFYPPYSQ